MNCLTRPSGETYIYNNGAVICGSVTEFRSVWHRENGPAVIHPDGAISYWVNNLNHRTNGPAVISSIGEKTYAICDVLCTPTMFFLKYGVL